MKPVLRAAERSAISASKGVFFFLCGVFSLLSGCQGRQKSAVLPDDRTLSFVFYNVENLYDISDDPRINDQEFLPAGRKNWNEKKYREKLADLSSVLAELGGEELPEVIGLCEVENEQVVKDLVNQLALVGGNYQVIHHHDRDGRGIDMALVYRPDEFTVDAERLIPVRSSLGNSLVRGILLVKGRSNNGEVFHIFVNHWPSRENDDVSRKEARKEMAGVLRRLTAPLMGENSLSHVVIMGDMNDEPDDESLSRVLGAGSLKKNPESEYINLMFPSMEDGHGSYKFQGDWKMLDNLIVSESLLDEEGYRVENDRGYVFSASWMEFINRGGEISPDRTYAGDNHTGGPSDHFPVYFRLVR